MPPDSFTPWKQYRGDPAIRGGLFEQCRVRSAMDDQFNETFCRIENLMSQHGVFHAKLHFSSSRATLWRYNDPCRYRVLSLDELLTAAPAHDGPPTGYPDDAIVPSQHIRPILETFRTLRFSDEQLYLRSGSLNVINGLVGLNFSCDGSHLPMNSSRRPLRAGLGRKKGWPAMFSAAVRNHQTDERWQLRRNCA